MQRLLIALTIAATLSLTGCGAWWLPRAHKIDIQQGNLLDPDSVSAITTGMSKSQVEAELGKPLTGSIFRPDRWDYIYSLNRSGERPVTKQLTVHFERDSVVKIEKKGVAENQTDTSASQNKIIE